MKAFFCSFVRVIGWILAPIALVFFLVSAWIFAVEHTSKRVGRKFDAVEIGADRKEVIELMGRPHYLETSKNFQRYADQQCQLPCVQRVWYENKLSLGVEAWSIGFDGDGHVIEKYRWVSP